MQPPFLITPSTKLQENLPAILAAWKEHGVVLLRASEKVGLHSFEALTKYFCDVFHDVGTRQKLLIPSGDGYTSEVFRQNFILLGHTEGSYRPIPLPPEVCFFMCQTPAGVGGETTLVDGAEMLELLPTWLVEKFLREGVIYECLWDRARWQAELKVDSVKNLYQLLSTQLEIKYQILADDLLHVKFPLPAVTYSLCGKKVFANAILAHLPYINHPQYSGAPVYCNPNNKVYFGDGGIISDDVVNVLINAHDKVLYRHAWVAEDILIIDNTRYMHGRTTAADMGERIIISRFGRLRAPLRESIQLSQ